MERPRVVAIAVVDEDIAVARVYVLRGTFATITEDSGLATLLTIT